VVLTEHRTVTLPLEGAGGFLRVAAIGRPEPVVVSDVRRHEVFTAVSDYVATLPGDDPAADGAAMAAYLRGVPEFEGVGAAPDGSVYARFRDGIPFAILNGRPPANPAEFDGGVDVAFLSGDEVLGGAPAPVAGALRGLAARGEDGVSGTPVSRRAVLMHAEEVGINAPMLASLAPAFESQGFTVNAGDATLQAFLGLSTFGSDMGVFYVDAHGGTSSLRVQEEEPETGNVWIYDIDIFVIGTSTVSTPAADAFYKEWLIKTGEVAYAQLGPAVTKAIQRYHVPAPPPPQPKPVVKSPTYYCITPLFVRNRIRFSRNSLVFIDTCYSGAGGAASFREACFSSGAAFYAGWTDSVKDSWAYNHTTRPLFDLLLGGSPIYQVQPPQRPFDIAAVIDFMDRKGLLVDRSPGFPGAKFACWPGPAANGSLRILNPSILSMGAIESAGEIVVSGLFDPEAAATVRVEGDGLAEVAARSVTRNSLTFPLEATASPSAGKVTVTQHGRQSNTVPLSDWTIDATLVKHFSPGQDQPSATMEFSLRFRGDVHEGRLKPFEAPVFRGGGASIARGATGKVTSASGVYFYPEDRGTVEWRLDSPVDVPFEDLRGVLSIGADRRANLTASLMAGNVMTVTDTIDGVPLVYQREPGTGVFPPGISAVDTSTGRIEGGSGSAAGNSGTFDWEASDPEFPPTGDFAR
jgi:hypothetical protein